MLYTLSGIKLKLATIAALQYSLNIAFTIKDFSTQLAPSVENIDKLIVFCSEARSFSEMLAFMDLTDRTKFRRKYIHPLLEAGIIEQTMPEKPNSQNQKYRLTAKGIALKNSLTNNK